MNIQQLTAHFGLKRGKIHDYIAEGMPYVKQGSKGVSWEFDQDEVAQWLEEHKRDEEAQALIKQQQKEIEGEIDEQVKRKRIEKLEKEIEWQTIRTQKELERLVPIEDVAKIYESQLTTIRTQLRTIPSKLAPRIEKLSTAAEIKDALQKAIDDTLTELSVPSKYKQGKSN
jgi:phage terminase Nu1 subunit (DNA packaging protein)